LGRYGVSQWFGVHDDRLLDVVPAAANFEVGTTLFTASQLYDDSEYDITI